MTDLEALKADMEAKHTAFTEANALYSKALCDAHPIQPGDVVEWERYAGEITRGRVTRLEWLGWKMRIYAKVFRKNGILSARETDIEWWHPKKVEEQAA